MKTVTGFIGAVVRAGINGKHEVVVSFETEEQAAKFQNIAYAINCFAGCSTGEEIRIDVPPLSDKFVKDDGFMDGIAKTQEEAGFGSHSRGGGKEPSERQVALAKLIAKKLIVAMPTEYTKAAYFKFISRYKGELDKQIEAEKGAKNV